MVYGDYASGCKCHGATFCPDEICIGYEDDQPIYVRRDSEEGRAAVARLPLFRITLTLDIDQEAEEVWGARDAWAAGGEAAVRELAMEDLGELVSTAKWKIEKFG